MTNSKARDYLLSNADANVEFYRNHYIDDVTVDPSEFDDVKLIQSNNSRIDWETLDGLLSAIENSEGVLKLGNLSVSYHIDYAGIGMILIQLRAYYSKGGVAFDWNCELT